MTSLIKLIFWQNDSGGKYKSTFKIKSFSLNKEGKILYSKNIFFFVSLILTIYPFSRNSKIIFFIGLLDAIYSNKLLVILLLSGHKSIMNCSFL